MKIPCRRHFFRVCRARTKWPHCALTAKSSAPLRIHAPALRIQWLQRVQINGLGDVVIEAGIGRFAIVLHEGTVQAFSDGPGWVSELVVRCDFCLRPARGETGRYKRAISVWSRRAAASSLWTTRGIWSKLWPTCCGRDVR